MDTTLTVRLDPQLKDEGERKLDSLGLSMSSAIRVFLTHVVAQQVLPFPVQGTPSWATACARPAASGRRVQGSVCR